MTTRKAGTATKAAAPAFARRVIAWQRRHGRHDLPWQNTRDPYRLWLSEIMLQQTQVAAVIPYYERFLARFPALADLATAPADDVLKLWSGLGYYARARNLHRAAQAVLQVHGGTFPRAREAVEALPGIGRSTAAAIVAFAYGERAAILDGNVKRVFARHFGVHGWPGEPKVAARLWALAEAGLPAKDIEPYTQGLMDLGATVCTRTPRCEACPVSGTCVAYRRGLTATIPASKPRAALPHRRTAMLVALHAGCVLLEKRPSQGIWGGLWSLPEYAADGSGAGVLDGLLGKKRSRLVPLEPVEHGFTHYRLTIEPHVARLARPLPDRPGYVWLPLADTVGAALPAPVKRILAGLTARV
jgi:A/G-specific adenine glycosylase